MCRQTARALATDGDRLRLAKPAAHLIAPAVLVLNTHRRDNIRLNIQKGATATALFGSCHLSLASIGNRGDGR